MLRGTLGAFIRGGLDTATQAIQQVNVSDEEKIVNKLQQFGASHDKYAEGLAEHNKESELITDVASSLSVQGDESLQDINEQDMRSLARTLITLSGATDSGKALEYFVNNRDNLAPKVMSTAAPAVEQTDQMLTDSDTATQQPKQRNFLQRIFQGKTDEQIKAEVINRAGVTEEAYDRIVAGAMPTRPDLTVGFSIGQEDKYKAVIKENQSTVLSAIRTGQPIFKTEEGKKLAQNYLTEHASYMIGADGAKSGEEILAMQNDILTFASPPEAKNFFSVYDDSLQTLRTRLFGKDIQSAEYEKALPIFKEIMGMKRSAVSNPKFAENVENANKYADKVFDLAEILRVGSGGNEDKFKLVGSLLDDALKHARTNSDQYTADQLSVLFKMPEQLSIAKQEGDMDIISGIFDVLQNTIPEVPEGSESMSVYAEKKNDLVNFYMSEQGGSHDKDTASNMAIQHLASGGLVTVDGIPHVSTIVKGKQMIVPVPIGRADRSGVVKPRPKVEKENNSKISKNLNSTNDIGRAIQLLKRNPNGFNMIGDFILRTQDGVDMANSVNVPIPGFEQSAAEIQEMRQRTIPLISTAKDALFEDPRLSDQDLRIVLDYVAVINDAGIGTTRAMQALLGLTEALAMDTALRLHQNTPDVKIVNVLENGQINLFNEQGELDLDSTIAGRTMKSLASSQGFQILDKESYNKLNTTQLKTYKENMLRITTMAKRIVGRVNSFRDLKGDTENYRNTYADHSSLFSYNTVITPASAVDAEIEAGKQRLLDRIGE